MIADDVADIAARLRKLEQAKEPPAPPPAPIVYTAVPDYPGQFDTTPDPWGFEGFCC